MSDSVEDFLVCPFCAKPARLANGAELYPHRDDLAHKLFWLCKPCGAYVGCHPGSEEPLGRLADMETRAARVSAHDAFDALWKTRGMSRGDAYRWLAGALGLPKDACHIGRFSVEQCRQAVRACEGKVGRA